MLSLQSPIWSVCQNIAYTPKGRSVLHWGIICGLNYYYPGELQ